MRHIFVFLLALIAISCAASDPGAPGAGGSSGVDAGADETGQEAAEIGELGGMCGGIAGFQCKAEGSYCRMEPDQCVDVADAAGTCAIKPEICTMEYVPVCGCDGETYGNACSAAGKGVSVAYEGECTKQD